MVIPWRRIVRSDGEWFERRRRVIQRCLTNIHAVVGSTRSDSHRVEQMIMRIIAMVLVGLVLYPLATGLVSFRSSSDPLKRELIAYDRNAFEDALSSYRSVHGRFPTDADGLHALMKHQQARNTGWYLYLVDPWGNPYVYETYSGGQACIVLSLGADGVKGGRGENRDRTVFHVTY